MKTTLALLFVLLIIAFQPASGLVLSDRTGLKFVFPEEFDQYKKMANAKGFLMVSSSPLTRSSYHASEDFKKMKITRENLIN